MIAKLKKSDNLLGKKKVKCTSSDSGEMSEESTHLKRSALNRSYE